MRPNALTPASALPGPLARTHHAVFDVGPPEPDLSERLRREFAAAKRYCDLALLYEHDWRDLPDIIRDRYALAVVEAFRASEPELARHVFQTLFPEAP
jgi:hypothetical protein